MDKVKFLNVVHAFNALAYRLGKILEEYKVSSKGSSFDIPLNSVLLCLDELVHDGFDEESIDVLKKFFVENFSNYIGVDVLSYLFNQVLYLIFWVYRNGVSEKTVANALCSIANEYQLQIDDTYAWLFVTYCVWEDLDRNMFFDKGIVENLPVYEWVVKE